MGGDREKYREAKRGYNRLCEKKKREKGDRWLEVVKNAKTKEQVWEVVKKEKKRGGSMRKSKWRIGRSILRG